jgi:amino acid adenylation domain-containing protein
LHLMPIAVDTQTAKFDLSLVLMDTGQGLSGGIEYKSDLFDAATIRQLAHHWQTLLESIVANPNSSIDDLALLKADERTAILNSWSNTPSSLTASACYPQLFEAQVDKTPSAVALTLGEERLTYGELNQRANQLAHHLRVLGVQKEVCVGVYLERSLDFVVALLAIFKAGAAYLPLDPAYPAERVAFMLADAQTPIVLTHQHLLADLPRLGVTAVPLDAEWPAEYSSDNPPVTVTADDLAYVIYTSGSTGQPKGVLVTHGALAQHCLTIQDHYDLTAADKVLQFASFNFDASLEQLLPPLLCGAQVLLRGTAVPTAAVFCQQMRDLKLTVVNLPTAYWQQLAWAWDEVQVWLAQGQLQLLVVGGEAMAAAHLQRWLALDLKGVRLLNAYGPTETTITALTFDVSCLDAAELPTYIPIGKPLPDRQLYILDKHRQPVPSGVPGELYIGGPCLARGYLNRPALSEEQFVAVPLAAPGATAVSRLYKTGDRVRVRADGHIEFLGRADRQVKLRGYRIELG